MSPAKIGVAAVWLLCLSAFFVATESTVSLVGRWVFLFLVVAHAIECVAFLPLLRKAPGGLGGHLFQTFLFGLFHLREVRSQVGDQR